MEVIILAGGLGTRLRSAIGNEIPKCMAPIDNKPFLWYLLRYLTRYDVSRVVLSVGYLREVIYKWVDDVRDDFPFLFEYAVEETPLGTGGGIREALKHCLNDNVVILNGDTFFDVDLVRLMNEHIRMGLVPYYLYRQKNIAGNFENVGYAEQDKAGVYNILIMEEKQAILACGAGASTKRVWNLPDGYHIERCENVKDIKQYIARIDEMIERKKALFEKD